MDVYDNEPVGMAESPVSQKKFLKKQLQLQINEHLGKINASYAFTIYGNKTCILKTDDEEIRYFSEDAFKSIMRPHVVWYDDETGKTNVKLGPRWLAWPRRRSYDDVVFYPGDISDRNVYNLWKGFAFEPEPIGSCDLFLDHIRVNICSENNEHYNWLLDWMADAIQRPWRKNWTALLLESPEEGTGKGFFVNHFGKLFGRHFTAFNKPSQLLGKFNSHIEDKLIVFLDEGSLIEKYAYDYAKSLITEPTIQIEPKGHSMREVKSYHRVIVASNDEHILRATAHDRRWTALRVSAHCKNNLGYFSAIEAQLRNGGYQALMKLLSERKYNEENVKITLKTESLSHQKEQSVSPLLDWWRTCLKAQRIGLMDWPHTILTTDLYKSYINFCDEMKVNVRVSNYSITKRLKHEVGLDMRSFSGSDHRYYALPDIEEARKIYEQKMNMEINWND